MSKEVSMAEVAKHKTDKDCWVVIKGNAYNVTNFLADHPGGKKAILMYAGKDATQEFEMLHKPDIIVKYGKDMKVGPVKN
jgi:cytochrome b involved in lipid metabolism